jgi:hypothetical protein
METNYFADRPQMVCSLPQRKVNTTLSFDPIVNVAIHDLEWQYKFSHVSGCMVA